MERAGTQAASRETGRSRDVVSAVSRGGGPPPELVVVEALWSPSHQVCLWAHEPVRGEGPALADDATGPQAGELLHLLPPVREAGGGRAVDLTLLLPGSTGLLRRRWPTLAINPNVALDALPALAQEAPPGVRLGLSAQVLARICELALELLAGGRFLPALLRAGERHVARWVPRLEPDDRDRLRVLAEALPPAARAEVSDAGPEGPTARKLAEDFLAATVDAAARVGGRQVAPPRYDGTAAAAWVTALTASGGAMNGPPDRLGRLRQSLESWLKAAAPPDAPFRTCFRLQPPESDSPDLRWSLDFLLQARDEPSLLVDAGAVWRAPDRLQLPGRIVEAPQELLLADLGRASRLWPPLERSLHEATPARLGLDAQGAHDFLREGAPLLAQSGFGVLLPAWWRDQKERLGARLVARPHEDDLGTGLLGREGLCDYRWEAALGDEPLTVAELRNLAELKLPLVQLRGRWVEVRPDDLRLAVRALERQEREGGGTMTVPQLLRTVSGLQPVETGLPIVGVDAQGWLRAMLQEPTGWRPEALLAPDSFHGELRPYQERGLGWLRFLDRQGLGACLADDMGLGKTIQLLALLLLERAEGEAPGPTLLVCPMSLVGNWQHETARFAPSLAVHVHHGSGRLSGQEFAGAAAAADLVLTTYSLAARDRDVLAGVSWGRIVLDEAQNIKNRESAQAHAVRSLPTERRAALTGTPLENRLSELWSIMDFCNPGLLGTAADFRRRFAVPIERYRDDESASLLRRLTGPFVLRRLKTDRSIIADLPDKVEIKVFCNITREQATLYQAILDDMLARIQQSSGIARRGYVLATMTRLKQVLNHPAHLLHDGTALAGRSGKLQRLEEVLEEVLADDDRALVFTQYAEMGGLLQRYLAEGLHQEVLFLHGETPKAQRDEMVERFQTGEGPSIFLLSLKAGGTGLNLTAANHVIHFDRWWNPAVEDQATDRAFRIGQRRDVQVRKLICVGTLEERIDRMLEDKRALAQQIVGSGEGWLTELSTEELRDLVELSRDAVAE